MHTSSVQRKILFAVLALSLTSCFKKGADTEPDPNMGKAKFNVTPVTSKTEAESAQFQLTLNKKVSEDITLNYTTSAGTATAGVDYVETAGSITIPQGSTTILITVPVMEDNLVEANETINLIISGEHRRITLKSTSAVTEIIDNDTYPTASIVDVSNLESANAVFTVTLDKTYPEDITIDYTLANSTATQPADFTDNSGTLTITGGSLTGTITVPVTDDTLDENDENFNIVLSNPNNVLLHATNFQAVATIQDDDGTPNLDVADTTAAEAANIVFTVSIPSASALPITFDWATSDGTGLDAFDYTANTGSGTIPAGSTSTTVSISGLDDALSEATETMNLTISNPTNSMLGDATGVGSITDDDPIPSISIADITIVENVNAVLTVTMNAVAGRDITFDWATAAATATHDANIDFAQVTTTTETITTGNTTATLTVNVTDDAIDEPDETFTVVLSNPASVTIGTGTSTITVQDNDSPAVVNWSTATLNINEGQYGPSTDRIKLDFNNSARPTNLIDFPVLVRLNGTKIDYTKTNNNGSNIRFLDSDGTTHLSHEIEKWDESGESLIWVKVPQIDASSSTDHIFLYYGDPSLTDVQDPKGVWNSNYLGVYHMTGVNRSILDSTNLQKHGTNLGAVSQPGQISESIYFDATDAASLGSNAHLPQGNSAITVCAWATQAALAGSEMFFSAGTETPSDGFFLGSTSGAAAWAGTFGSNNHTSVTLLSTSTWYYQCGAYSPNSSSIYLNGAHEDTDARNYSFNLGNITLGRAPLADSFKYAGNIDELRISNIKRSADWINAEYASMSGSLITYNTQEANLSRITITANLDTLSGYAIDIPYTIAGTSTASDHNAVGATLSIAAEAGTTATFTFDLTNDQISEMSETILVNMGTPVNADQGATTTQTITITDDEALPSINFTTATQTTYESSWWNASWLSRRKINIDASTISTDLDGFPLLVKLNSNDIDYAKVQNAGEDLRFLSEDHEELLPYEIEKWNESDTSYVWVRIPKIKSSSNSSHFYVYYDNSGASAGQNKEAVWDEHFNAVMHLADSSDSSSFNLPTTNNGAIDSGESFIGDNMNFPASTNIDFGLDMLNTPVASEHRSYCAWAKGSAAGATGIKQIVATSHARTPYNGGFRIYRFNDGLRTTTHGSTAQHSYIDGVFETQEWKYYCFTYDGTYTRNYINDVLVDTRIRAVNTFRAGTQIGSEPKNATETFLGNIDEVRISNIARSADWIKMEYQNVMNGNYIVEDEETFTANSSFTFTITSSHESVNTINIPVLVSGTSSNPADHNLNSTVNLSLSPGQKSITHSFNLTDDVNTEVDETIVLTLGAVTNSIAGSTNVQTITIKDDDNDPIINFTLPGSKFAESAGGVNVELSLNKNAPTDVTIPYTISGSATGPADHDLVSGTVSILTGNNSVNIPINIVNDTMDEWGEDIVITLGAVVGATKGSIDSHRAFIEDDDLPPVISVDSPSALENAGSLDFTISLSAVSGKDVIFYQTGADVTASSRFPNPNYTQITANYITIPAGTLTHTTTVNINDNNFDETDKTFTLTITGSTLYNATAGTVIGTATIQDDEVTPTANFSIASQDIDEQSIWWDSSFTKRLKLTMNNKAQSSNLDNFPVLVKLNSTRLNYSDTLNAGEDIRFVDANGITILDYEIEKWDEAGDSFVWVKVPRVDAASSTDHIWMYYGNAGATDNQNATGTWNNSYRSIMHFNTDYSDSTNNINATNNGTTLIPGKLGTTANFVRASSQFVEITDIASDITGDFSISMWMKSSTPSSWESFFVVNTTSFDNTFILNLQSDGTVRAVDGTTDEVNALFPLTNNWHLFNYVLNGTTGKLYIDGVYMGFHTTSYNINPTNLVFLGNDKDPGDVNSDFFNGSMDEVRISNTALSDDWVKAQYLSQADKLISYENQALTVSLDVASETDITVPYTVSGTATNPSDHSAATGSITIPAKQLAANIGFNVVNDAVAEADETVIFTMGAPTGASKGATDVHTATIKDDDGKSSLSINDVTIGESGTAILTVSLAPTLGTTVTVDWQTINGSADSATDYTTGTGTLTFLAGESSKTINVVTTNDSLDEYSEFLNVTLSNPTSATARITDAVGRVTITDDDPLVDADFSLATSTKPESSGTVSVTARINTVSGKQVRIPFTYSGTANDPLDYNPNGSQIIIPAGSTTATTSLFLVNDTIDEDDETVILTVGTPNNANVGTNNTHTMTVTDTDPAPSLSIQATSGAEGSLIALTAEISAISGKNVTFDWATVNGTALLGEDFVSASGTAVIIPAGSTTVSLGNLTTIDDSLYEGNETLTYNLSSIFNATSSGSNNITINDNESLPNVEFQTGAVDVMESSNYQIPIILDSPSTEIINVDYAINGSSTVDGSDHAFVDGTLVIPAGTSIIYLPSTIIDDVNVEANETMIIDISSPVNANIGGENQITITIKDSGAITASAVYTGNSNWMDYVENDETGKTKWKQTNTPCNAVLAVNSIEQCVHGAEFFTVDLGGTHPNCTNLSMIDSLDMFNWICDDSGANAIFYSTGMKLDKGLTSIVNLADGSIRQNSAILLESGVQTKSSTSSDWWTNPTLALPDNTASGLQQLNDTAGTIYYLNTTRGTQGYEFSQDKLAIVGGSLTSTVDVADNCNKNNGVSTSPDSKCVVMSGGREFLWIETNINSFGPNIADHALNLAESKYSRIHNSRFIRSTDSNVNTNNTHGLYISNSSSYDAGGDGFTLKSSNANILENIHSSFNVNGINFNLSYNNKVNRIKVNNNSANGMQANSFSSSSVTNVLTTNNGASGIVHVNGLYSNFSFVTSANNANSGLLINGGHYNTFNQILSTNNALDGFNISSASATMNKFSQSSSINNQSSGLDINASSLHFFDNLSAGANITTDCTVTGGTDPGLTHATCSNQGTSTANLVTGKALVGLFREKILINDSSNTDDSVGSKAYQISINQSFDSFYRAWGKTGSSFPNTDNTGNCSSGTCHIWDWRVKSSDTEILNRSNDANSANLVFTAGGACPAAVHGNKSFPVYIGATENNPAPGGDDDGICDTGEICNASSNALINAIEINNDTIGNNNGYCESNEACIYAPNIGAYQGEGDFKAAGSCNFTGGTVSGVQIYAYPNNGI